MSDDDLRVDYGHLADSETALDGLKSEFDDLEIRGQGTQEAWGHAGVRRAMAEFVGNLDVQRGQLSVKIQKVGEGIAETLESFRRADAELAASFDEERP